MAAGVCFHRRWPGVGRLVRPGSGSQQSDGGLLPRQCRKCLGARTPYAGAVGCRSWGFSDRIPGIRGQSRQPVRRRVLFGCPRRPEFCCRRWGGPQQNRVVRRIHGHRCGRANGDRAGRGGGDPEREGKLDPLDPLLWKSERPDEPAWNTVLGHGRPGWHIECSTIALTYLGNQIDVQGGGSDLTFPHHEMSAAQAESLTGIEPFARFYVHSGMVSWQGHKMSKSRGNLVFVSTLRHEGVEPAA
ncbi:MAG: class I tRNA ligase family protein, partial [Alphaproteobacteria bacterium]|nr:class I tRNA ligase family protein [Alphaproteobacteria bacterium]